MAGLKQRYLNSLSTHADWKDHLLSIITSASPNYKAAMVGVGHRIRGDDYVGSFIVKKLISQTHAQSIILFDAENEIESVISQIARYDPRHVVLVDACEMNAAPGTVDLLPLASTDYPFFTTHGIPLKLLATKFLPKATAWILAVQPRWMGLAEQLSPEVLAAANSVSDFIASTLKEGWPNA